MLAASTINGMLAQGSGFIYNMYGFGSTGMMRNGMSIYGSSKRAVNYFTETMIKELAQTPVKMGSLSPGMVITDLVSEQYKDRPEEFEKAKQYLQLARRPRGECDAASGGSNSGERQKRRGIEAHEHTPHDVADDHGTICASAICLQNRPPPLFLPPHYNLERNTHAHFMSSSSNSTTAAQTTFRNCARSC